MSVINTNISAMKAANRDDKGFAPLNQVAQIAGNRSSFDKRNYGYSRLIDLFEDIDVFQIERRGESQQPWVKRVR